MTQTKHVYSVAIRHKNGKNNLYQVELDELMSADQIVPWVTRLKVEVETAQTVLCPVTPIFQQVA